MYNSIETELLSRNYINLNKEQHGEIARSTVSGSSLDFTDQEKRLVFKRRIEATWLVISSTAGCILLGEDGHSGPPEKLPGKAL